MKSLSSHCFEDKSIDWATAFENFTQADIQHLFETHKLDIIKDFDEKDERSFIQNLKDKEVLKYVHHLRFSPVISKESWLEGCPWYGAHDFEEILSVLILIKENCPNVETIEVEYESSYENIKDNDARFDLFVEWFQSFENLKKVDFTIVEYKEAHTNDKYLKSFVSVLTSPLRKSKKIEQEITYIPEKLQDDVLYHLNLIYSDSSSINSDYVPIAIRKESPGSNNTKVITYDIHQHEEFISNLNEILEVLGPYLTGLRIDCSNTSPTFSFDEESHIKHIYNTCCNLENLEITQTEEYYHRNNSPIHKPLLSLIEANSFGAYLGSLSKLDVKYLHISNDVFYSMMKQFSENQDNDIYHLNLIYSAEHNSDYTSVSISKKKSEGDDSTRVITYDVLQNENLIGYNSNELLTTLGPYLDTLHVDVEKSSSDLSFDLEHIYTTCNKLCSLKISQPSGRYYESASNSSIESILIQCGAYLSNILELDVNNLCICNNGFNLMMKHLLENQRYDTLHQLKLLYSEDYSSDYTSIDIHTSKSESDANKRVITYYVYQNEKFISDNVSELMSVIGPHLTKLSINFKYVSENFFSKCLFDRETFMLSIFSSCNHLTALKIRAAENFCALVASDIPKYPKPELLEYLSNIEEIFMESFYSVNEGKSGMLIALAKNEIDRVARPTLRLLYKTGKPTDWNTTTINKKTHPESGCSTTTYHVAVSTTFVSTDKVLQNLGTYTEQSCKYSGENFDFCDGDRVGSPDYAAYYVSCIAQSLNTNIPPPPSEEDIVKFDSFNEKRLKALQDTAEKKERDAIHYFNILYCDSESTNLNSIHTHKKEPSGLPGSSDMTFITYNVRLNEKEAYNTTKMIVEAFGGFLIGLNIRFEEGSTHNFSFDEKEYLTIITEHCKVMESLKIRNFPTTRVVTQPDVHEIPKEFIPNTNELYEDEFYEDELYVNELYESELYEHKLYESELYEDKLYESELIEDKLIEDNLVEDNLIEDKLVEDNLVEDNLIEDKLVEDNLTEDKLVEGELIKDELDESQWVDESEWLDESELIEDKLIEDNLVEDNLVEDNLVEDNLVEDNLVEDNLVEDNLIEDNLIEDNLIEDKLVEDKLDESELIKDDLDESEWVDESEWLGESEWIQDGLDEIAAVLAKTRFEIEQNPLSDTMISLEKIVKKHTEASNAAITAITKMTTVPFDDMIACVEATPSEKTILPTPIYELCPSIHDTVIDDSQRSYALPN